MTNKEFMNWKRSVEICVKLGEEDVKKQKDLLTQKQLIDRLKFFYRIEPISEEAYALMIYDLYIASYKIAKGV